ncbi:MAG: M20/M25/M40 family metallo-hydrolase [Dehalococcoidia bacterium]
MTPRQPFGLPLSVAALVLVCLSLACTGDPRPGAVLEAPAPAGAVASATGTSTPPFRAPTAPDAARAMEHIRVLAGDIGVREAGTPGEQRAADYIRDQLERAGYGATIEAFPVQVPRDESQVLAVPPGNAALDAIAMAGAPDGEARGRLVFAGLGRAADYAGVDARGAIVLVNRGVASFREKAEAAQQAGAVALVVANTQPGPFRGTIAAGSPAITIPVVGVASEDASLLDATAKAGAAIGVRALRKSDRFESHNVVGQPSNEPCTAYVGAHYDSVPRAPGANDNASGTAGMLELARTQRAAGLCFVAFGSEEVGLFGSQAFVQAHGTQGVRYMLNLDMIGVLDHPEVVASDEASSRTLADRASKAAGAVGVVMPRGAFPQFASSDHATFTKAGIPAVTLYAGDDQRMHTPDDDVAHISSEAVGTMLKAGAAILADLQTGR